MLALRLCGGFCQISYSIGRIVSSACFFRLLAICVQPSGFVLRSGIWVVCISSRRSCPPSAVLSVRFGCSSSAACLQHQLVAERRLVLLQIFQTQPRVAVQVRVWLVRQGKARNQVASRFSCYVMSNGLLSAVQLCWCAFIMTGSCGIAMLSRFSRSASRPMAFSIGSAAACT